MLALTLLCIFPRYITKSEIAVGQGKAGTNMLQKAEMAFKLMDRWGQNFFIKNFSSGFKYLLFNLLNYRNNDGFITKQEMLSTTKKLNEKQVDYCNTTNTTNLRYYNL